METGLARTDLGEKQICPNCGAKFYDLRRRPAVCPKCTASFDPAEEGVRARRSRSRISAHEPALEEEEEELEEGKKVAATGDDEEEEVEAPEIDVEADAEPIVADDEDDDAGPAGDVLPEGFSEEEADLEEDAGDDDSLPMLEDEEEFTDDEIGELPGDDEDDDSSR